MDGQRHFSLRAANDRSQSAIQHDDTNYGSGFVTGRGNLCSVWRWDVTDIVNPAKAIPQQRTGYNSTGSVVFTRDALNHQTSISYTDSFSDAVNRNTFAFPTTVTDPDNFASTAQYNFDFGAVTRTQDPKGAVQTMTYETAGRIERVTNQVNGAYTRFYYHPYGDIGTFATIQDGAGEVFSVTYFDGAGRLRSKASDLPNSAGGYVAQFTLYDVMGRVSQQTNPAEMNGSWVPSGDDAAGWVWTYQTYDWNGRTRVTTLPDGAPRENTYGGCGCAGVDVTTVRDERGRRRRATTDVLGRLKQLDELNWDQSVYATTTYAYNARDQIAGINQAGLTRGLAYDGYGRLQSRLAPEQGTNVYSYFADDTTQTVTDARGATTTFAYNNRHLVTGITYGLAAGVAATANVSFGYDAAGNRTSMTDGLGSVSYGYNTLSQMTSETRTFNGVGSFTLTYGSYNLAGELTSMTNHWGAQAGYNYDKVGRPIGVSGSGYYGVTSYINSIGYRAFGLKQMSYANGRTLSLSYDNRLRLTGWDIPGVMGWNYAYNYFNENSGRVTYAQNRYDSTLDRSYDYDNVGRLISAHTGIEARAHIGIGPWSGIDGPYSQDRGYDQFGNATHRVGWGGYQGGGFDRWYNFASNRLVQDPGTGAYLQYDGAGNLTNDGSQSFTYDATGQQTYASGSGLTQSYDGDGLRVAKTENGVTTYYLRSSVLGGQVTAEINSSGAFTRGYVLTLAHESPAAVPSR